MKRDIIEFETYESMPSSCPVCGYDNLTYGLSDTVDETMLFPWKCTRCGATGQEIGNIIFAGHDVDIDTIAPQVLEKIQEHDEKRQRDA